jgi:hypothetical protein
MSLYFKKIYTYFILLMFILIPVFSFAESINISGPLLLPKAEIFLKPQSGTYQIGNNIIVPIYINTKGYSINTISLKINFDHKKIKVISQTNGQSILSLWLEPPNFDNDNGIINLTGFIPNGIITNNGLIGVITFETIAIGQAKINFSQFTTANLNDGYGTNVFLSFGNGIYNIYPKKVIEEIDIISPTLPIFIDQENISTDDDLNNEEEVVGEENLSPLETDNKIKHQIDDSMYSFFYNYNLLFLVFLIFLLIFGIIIHYYLGRYFLRRNVERIILKDDFRSEDAIEFKEDNFKNTLIK